jgi:isochorismate synthase
LRTPEHTALDLAAALHPTPAVGGAPRPAALRAIAQLEPVPRGFFAGLVGWVDGRGDGEWVLTLRCLEVRPDGTRLFAGAGIVAGSDPEAELAETEVKFTTLLQALGEG